MRGRPRTPDHLTTPRQRAARNRYERVGREATVERNRRNLARWRADPVLAEKYRARRQEERRREAHRAGRPYQPQSIAEILDRQQSRLAERNARQAWSWFLNRRATPEWKRQFINARRRHYHEISPRYALYHRLKRWMQKHLREKGGDSKKWSAALGYTVDELRQHLESRFLPGMSWANAGAWHIDHIRQVWTFTFSSPADPEFRECYALSNLRPLWAGDNLKRKRGKMGPRIKRELHAASSQEDHGTGGAGDRPGDASCLRAGRADRSVR